MLVIEASFYDFFAVLFLYCYFNLAPMNIFNSTLKSQETLGIILFMLSPSPLSMTKRFSRYKSVLSNLASSVKLVILAKSFESINNSPRILMLKFLSSIYMSPFPISGNILTKVPLRLYLASALKSGSLKCRETCLK